MAVQKNSLDLTLKIWRQAGPDVAGRFETHEAKGIPDSASFLEMLDIVNERIITEGGDPVAFDHDCREGICGMCSLVINGMPHGPNRGVTTCQLHMRSFRSGDTIWIEPFRTRSFKRYWLFSTTVIHTSTCLDTGSINRLRWNT